MLSSDIVDERLRNLACKNAWTPMRQRGKKVKLISMGNLVGTHTKKASTRVNTLSIPCRTKPTLLTRWPTKSADDVHRQEVKFRSGPPTFVLFISKQHIFIATLYICGWSRTEVYLASLTESR